MTKMLSVAARVDGPTTSDAPINTGSLPLDILSLIFLECLPHRRIGFPTVRTTDAPVLLGRICSHWRAVALSTPQLWAGLSLSIRPPDDFKKDAETAMEWKIRAGPCLLSYHLRNPTDVILDAILPHCGQWRHLDGYFEQDKWNRVYEAISQGAPNLRYLEIGNSCRDSSIALRNVTIHIPIPGASQLQVYTRKRGLILILTACRRILFERSTRHWPWTIAAPF
ncbi:hypothetical protein BD410DRAFT_635670 [Rickenella mellea]|uniref:F-box domain-containing protein n=1 Tax=Rickenella mellea TaxID=50990 RepID=A0A4Y7QE16_9AGAM|nr:hypothetical protein BD410DRAFT_635670 [Rickenella mellea]